MKQSNSALLEQAHANDKRFAAIVKQVTVGIAQVDASGAFVFVNDRYCGITGYSREELLGMRMQDITAPEFLTDNLTLFERLWREGMPFVIEKQYICKDGSRVWVNNSVAATFDDQGRTETIVCVTVDITARKEVENTLRETVRRYEKQTRLFDGIASTTPDFVYVFDPDGRFLFANRRLLEVWGMKLDDIVGKTCRDLGYEQWHHDMHMREIAEVIRTKRSIKGEVPFKAPLTGIFGVYEYIFSPVIAPDGSVELVAGTTRDITERKRAGQALRESEQRYRELFTSMTEGFCVLEKVGGDPVDFRCLVANPAFPQQSGMPDVAGKTLREFVPGEANEWIQVYDRVVTSGRPVRLQRRFETTGKVLEVYAYRVGEASKRQVGVVFHDVTEQKQAEDRLRESEERFRTMANSLPLLVWVHDASGQQQFVNSTFCEFFNVAPGEMVGERWKELVHPDDVEAYTGKFLRCLEARVPFHGEVRVRNAAGNWRVLESWGRPRFSASGEFHGFVGSSADITERKEAERALACAQDELRQHAAVLEQAVSERTARLQETVTELEAFSYSISHDMRSPLRAIEGYARVLAEDHGSELSEQALRYLDRMQKAACRLDLLVQDVLAYSKVAKGEIALTPTPLRPVIDGIMDQYPDVAEHRSRISIELDGCHVVLGHEAYLTQALSNLLRNAVKFVAPGATPQVAIEAEDRATTIRVSVRDNGIGIAPEHRGRLFQIFGRVHPEKRYPGTGIGLAIVKKAVERMEGTFGYESVPENGSVFWIELNKPA